MITVHITDTTDTRRPVLTVRCETARITRNQLILADTFAVYGAVNQETAEGNALAHERANEWMRDLEAGYCGTDRRLSLSLPEWAADLS